MIEIKKVSKRFDKIEAVSDVSLSIEEGQVFGLLEMCIRDSYIVAIYRLSRRMSCVT